MLIMYIATGFVGFALGMIFSDIHKGFTALHKVALAGFAAFVVGIGGLALLNPSTAEASVHNPELPKADEIEICTTLADFIVNAVTLRDDGVMIEDAYESLYETYPKGYHEVLGSLLEMAYKRYEITPQNAYAAMLSNCLEP